MSKDQNNHNNNSLEEWFENQFHTIDDQDLLYSWFQKVIKTNISGVRFQTPSLIPLTEKDLKDTFDFLSKNPNYETKINSLYNTLSNWIEKGGNDISANLRGGSGSFAWTDAFYCFKTRGSLELDEQINTDNTNKDDIKKFKEYFINLINTFKQDLLGNDFEFHSRNPKDMIALYVLYNYNNYKKLHEENDTTMKFPSEICDDILTQIDRTISENVFTNLKEKISPATESQKTIKKALYDLFLKEVKTASTKADNYIKKQQTDSYVNTLKQKHPASKIMPIFSESINTFTADLFGDNIEIITPTFDDLKKLYNIFIYQQKNNNEKICNEIVNDLYKSAIKKYMDKDFKVLRQETNPNNFTIQIKRGYLELLNISSDFTNHTEIAEFIINRIDSLSTLHATLHNEYLRINALMIKTHVNFCFNTDNDKKVEEPTSPFAKNDYSSAKKKLAAVVSETVPPKNTENKLSYFYALPLAFENSKYRFNSIQQAFLFNKQNLLDYYNSKHGAESKTAKNQKIKSLYDFYLKTPSNRNNSLFDQALLNFFSGFSIYCDEEKEFHNIATFAIQNRPDRGTSISRAHYIYLLLCEKLIAKHNSQDVYNISKLIAEINKELLMVGFKQMSTKTNINLQAIDPVDFMFYSCLYCEQYELKKLNNKTDNKPTKYVITYNSTNLGLCNLFNYFIKLHYNKINRPNKSS